MLQVLDPDEHVVGQAAPVLRRVRLHGCAVCSDEPPRGLETPEAEARRPHLPRLSEGIGRRQREPARGGPRGRGGGRQEEEAEQRRPGRRGARQDLPAVQPRAQEREHAEISHKVRTHALTCWLGTIRKF